MKHLINAIAILVIFSACCKKEKCVIPGINIRMYNFKMNEVDSIVVYKYEKGNNFIKALDTTYLSATLSSDNEFYSAYSNIQDPNFIYLIKIKGFTKEYRITNLRMTKSKCNSGCGLFTSKRDDFIVLADYQLNGELKDDFVIEVYK
jgi:hypothetical protein